MHERTQLFLFRFIAWIGSKSVQSYEKRSFLNIFYQFLSFSQRFWAG